MSDFAPCLTKAFSVEFPDAIQAKCFDHLKQNVKKRHPKFFTNLEAYIDNLGMCTPFAEINSLWKIIKKDMKDHRHLKDIADEFIDYV